MTRKMRVCSKIQLRFLLISISCLVGGCTAPMHYSHEDVIAVRTNANNQIVERLLRKTGTWEYSVLLTPEGPQTETFDRRARFFVADKRGKRTKLRFLEEKGDDYGNWSMVRAVAETSCWVRVERQLKIENIRRGSQALQVTVFDVHGYVHERKIETSEKYNDVSRLESHILFGPGNRILTWKTEGERFDYNVIDDALSQSDLSSAQVPQ